MPDSSSTRSRSPRGRKPPPSPAAEPARTRSKAARPAWPRFGAHMSVAGGLHEAFGHAARAGCDCVQVFVKNQRQWNARPLGDDDLIQWRAAAQQTGIRPVTAHATYLINLASPDAANWEKSIAAFVAELRRCASLDIAGLVVHPGAHMGAGESAGNRRVAAALDRVVTETASDRMSDGRPTEVWLEITAGQGSCLGHRFEHLGEMMGSMRDARRVGVCFDTCHALAAGYRFDGPDCYAETFDEFDRRIGLDRLRCFHLNDSLRELGSRVDRHTHIGRGHVGRGAFRLIVNDPRFARLPMILETPKGTDPRGRDLDRLNLAALRRMVRH